MKKQNKEKILSVPLNEEELRKIKELAEEQSLPLATYVRWALLRKQKQ